MEIRNTYNGGPKDQAPKTPETDRAGNENVEQDNNPKTSGDSQPQHGQNIVNAQDQNDIVNGQDSTGAEEFIETAANNTEKANDSPLNNENGANPQSGIHPL